VHVTLGSQPSGPAIEIRRIPYGTRAADELLEGMDAEMGALYADTREGREPEMARLVGVALTVHPEEMVAAIGAFDGDRIVGHAALRPFGDALEVKRVYVHPDYRGQGLSKKLMLELEAIANERGVGRLVLQTGARQLEAIALYERLGYVSIPLFGLYEQIPFFLCYGKALD
jgi:GNAT superfamily N-acetyltransferase